MTDNRSKARLISIIDDDESVREGLKSLVRALGYAVETFASAEEFSGSHQRDRACLILDVRLGGMSGLELHRRLLATGCPMPVIFITAHDDQAVRERALKAGAVAFLQKPVQREALVNAIQVALGSPPSPT